MDLVHDAGVDISDWANFKGGKNRAGSNPKYCYEWSFVEPGTVVVLNLWHAEMKEQDGAVVREFNLRKLANEFGQIPGRTVWRKRALKMDAAIQEAIKNKLPVRVIVAEGVRRGVDQPKTKASKVRARLLDPTTWAITKYDWDTGHCVLTRGGDKHFADQFSLPPESEQAAERRPVSGHAFIRNPDVRRRVLQRANGKCEWCTKPGFITSDGRYLETHHVIPLSESGSDTESNVVALCPNHHREAHHGASSAEIREALISRYNGRPNK
jgi:5-methylcytosine-specific restriction enzyme A